MTSAASTASPEPRPSGGPLAAWGLPALLVLLSAPILFWGLGSYSVVNGDEAFYHGVAVHMVESGDWTRIEFTGEHRVYDTFMNAPLQYWARALLISSFGDNLWTMRALSALFGLAGVLMTYRLTLYVFSYEAAFLAGFIQLTTLQYVYLHASRTGELDTALAFLLTASAYRFLRGIDRGESFAWHHLCLAVMANLKAPIILIPLAAELAVFALDARTRVHFGRWLRSLVPFLALAYAWHVWQAIYLWDEFVGVLQQMLSEGGGREGLGLFARVLRNVRYYTGIMIFGAFPYVFVYPIAVAAMLFRTRDPTIRRRWRLLGAYIGAILLFYVTLPKIYPWYLMPAYPLLSMFVAAWLTGMLRSPLHTRTLVATGVLVSLVPWVGVGIEHYNPFAVAGKSLSLEPGLYPRLGVPPIVGIPLGAALLTGSLWLLRARLGPALAARVAVGGLAAVLCALGLVRCLYPLRHLGHQSEMARVSARIDEARSRGQALSYPIGIRERGHLRVRYYFADDFDIVRERRGGVTYLLYRSGEGRAHGRVVNRGDADRW